MNATHVFAVGPEPEIVVQQVDGDFTISGWDRNEIHVRVDGREEDTTIQQHENGITIATGHDCSIQAPLRTRLRLQSVDGDAAITMLLNTVDIGSVDGDLSVTSVGPTTIVTVDGDLTVRAVAGSLTVSSVDGDAHVSQIAGAAQLSAVDGDLALNEVVGNVFATADGDARLALQLAPGQVVTVAASGDILCQVQPDAGVTVKLTADGDIRVKNLGEAPRASNTSLDFVLGDGSAALQLTADGDITLRGAARPVEAEFGFGDEISEEMSRRAAAMGAQITREVETQVEALTRDLAEKFNRMAENEELSARIQDKVAAAMRRAEAKLAEAMRKIEVRTQEPDTRRRKGYGWVSPPPAPPAPPAPPHKAQATDEERIMVLRMVEQGRLSVDQAEKLLAALTGRKLER